LTRASRRRAGLVIPLFSCPSSTSWGIGDIGDLAAATGWLAGAGQRVLQLLPLNEMAPGQHSPYSALSAMAIDPIFIRVPAVADFAALGGERALPGADLVALDEARRARRVDYATVRRLKQSALRAAFDWFLEAEWSRDTDRARLLEAFVSDQSWWVSDYALFRAIHAREANRPWTEWPEPLRRRDWNAIDETHRELWREELYHQYLQWLAATQWQEARRAAAANHVELFGDLPFMVDGDSADVWAWSDQFRLDASVGSPPDAFSATGQDWDLPVYRWDVMAADGFRWLRNRSRRSADLYDGYRVDHLVGFYRTYSRPRDGGAPFFTPDTETEQRELGELILRIFRESGSEIVAEDLGTVPDFVRESLARIGVPGIRLLRWERFWNQAGQPFRDPADYPAASMATSSTHDTEPLAVWWETADAEARRGVNALPTVQRLTKDAGLLDAPYRPVVRDTLLEALFQSGAELVLLPVQDVFGWRDRINEPGTVTDANWTYRLPWPVDRLDEVDEARERQSILGTWAARSGRLPEAMNR